ncbi:MAG: polysaccharide deacetylase family protein [Cytophagales bacterium]|nr:polysaccharide deacetylase family protein [Cytophagales bacterium]
MRILLLFLCLFFSIKGQSQSYAEKLGYPKDAKVLILHIDDVGMSYDSNLGAIKAMEEGVANSLSMMMPCSWIPGFFKYLEKHPETDAGLHLTLTSEWDNYRWGPLAGKPAVPGLVDKEGALWPSVMATATNASADEIETEIRAQLDRSRSMGWEPTHLDSHMGTLFAKQDFLMRYLKVGMEENIPVMFPGGHNSMIMETAGSTGLTKEMTTTIGEQLWAAGLPVLDDLHNISYGWKGTDGMSKSDLQRYKTEKYIESLKALQPGLTMVIMHCTWPTEVFEHISESGQTREGDLLAMMSPELKKYIVENNIVLTTWREAKKRRDALKK